ncbi:metalloproteinase inhibitor 1-like [Lineus longissimus]|uniref:metalloproteinase inhibitor 1-like n=1 Tax=Lineus longissimus TaxID=88925 RepID=UPI002B4F0E65
MLLFFKLFTVLLVAVGLSKGCAECDFPHPQERFCEAPYVIRATVTSSSVIPKPRPDADMPKHRIISPWPINYKYELTVDQIFKRDDTVDLSTEPLIMYASFGPEFCGLPPGGYVGKEFLIYGKKLRPEDAGSLQPQITACGNTVPWDEVSAKYLDKLVNTYGPACQECRISRDCDGESCKANDTCTWNVGKNFMDLCLKDKVCKRMENGKCDWVDREKCDHEDMPDWMKITTTSKPKAEVASDSSEAEADDDQ